GEVIGRNHLECTGFGRVPVDEDGHYLLRTLPPGGVPYISVCVFARGLLRQLYTPVYLPHRTDPEADPLRSSLPRERRATLLAMPARERESSYRSRLRADG